MFWLSIVFGFLYLLLEVNIRTWKRPQEEEDEEDLGLSFVGEDPANGSCQQHPDFVFLNESPDTTYFKEGKESSAV